MSKEIKVKAGQVWKAKDSYLAVLCVGETFAFIREGLAEYTLKLETLLAQKYYKLVRNADGSLVQDDPPKVPDLHIGKDVVLEYGYRNGTLGELCTDNVVLKIKSLSPQGYIVIIYVSDMKKIIRHFEEYHEWEEKNK